MANAGPKGESQGGVRKRVFEIDIEQCPQCSGTLKNIAAIEHPPVTTKIPPISVWPPEHRPE